MTSLMLQSNLTDAVFLSILNSFGKNVKSVPIISVASALATGDAQSATEGVVVIVVACKLYR